MTCAERKDLIFLHAAEQLEPAEAQELRAHLASGCPICAGAMAEAQATLAQVACAVEPVSPRVQAREKLMAHVAGPTKSAAARARLLATAGEQGARATAQTVNRWRIFSTALLSAAAGIAITCAVLIPRLNDMRTKPVNLQMVSMSGEQNKAHGMVAWDRDRSQWHVVVFDLTPPPPGKEYELWFITPGGTKIPSKTFNVDQNGKAELIVEVPKDIGPIAMAAITDEPMGGMPQPTGSIHLKGAVP